MQASLVPPKVSVPEETLQEWTDALEKERANWDSKEEARAYETWLDERKRKVAPGFSFGVMTPQGKPHTL